jgi:tetratricopeptide (TPR) repeat protein
LTERDPHAAVQDARAAVRDRPADRRAARGLAAALRAVGDVAEAEHHERRAIDLGLCEPAVIRARQALAANQMEAAAKAIQPYVLANPDDAAALHVLGMIAERCRSLREAEGLLRRAVALAPGYAEAQLSLASLFNRTRRTDESLAAVNAVLDREPTHHAALSLKARMLVQYRRIEAADAAFVALTGYHPDNWQGWLNHGHLLKTIGRIEDAVVAYRRSHATAPTRGIVWWALANLKSVRFDAADVAAMRAALAASTDDADRVHLHFALGHALDASADQAAAFAHLRAGNALRLSHAPHDADLFSATLRRGEGLFTHAFLAARADAGATAPDPIFIVGMPRAGSTLVEQILASHPLVEGTEELRDLDRVAKSLVPQAAGGSYLDGLAALPPARLRELGERYLATTRRYVRPIARYSSTRCRATGSTPG